MLTQDEKKRTGQELRKNYEISELTPEQIQMDLGISKRELTAILNIEHCTADPTNVWRVRDYMEEKINENGKVPFPYSKLNNNIYYPY